MGCHISRFPTVLLAFQRSPPPPRNKSRDHQKQLRAAFPIRSGTDGRIGEVRACCAWALAHLGQLSKRCGLHLSNGDIAEFKETGDVFLQCYTALALHALQNGVCRWALKPKHHQLQHSLEEVGIDKLNPSFFWNFADEDMLGRLKPIAGRTHRAKMSQRTLQRYLVRVNMRWKRRARGQRV